MNPLSHPVGEGSSVVPGGEGVAEKCAGSERGWPKNVQEVRERFGDFLNGWSAKIIIGISNLYYLENIALSYVIAGSY
jgi:hypothetical protein